MDRLFVVAAFFVIVTGASAWSQEGPRLVKMAVSPAPASDSPLPYLLFPQLRDIKPGNAAVFYQRSQALEWWGAGQRKYVDKAIDTLANPWKVEHAEFLRWRTSHGALREIDWAARCEHCDWQILERVRADGVFFIVADISALRTIGVMNQVTVRSAIHQREFEKAAFGLQSGFAMAKHIGEAPLLFSYLIGSSLTAMAQNNLEEWIQQPDAPSLYWAITDLPQPLIDWRRALESDNNAIDQIIPEIRQALQEKTPTPIPVPTLQKRIKTFLEEGRLIEKTGTWAFAIASIEPQARAYFAARLPVTQLGLMYLFAEHDRHFAEVLKTQNLPYWQARRYIKKLTNNIHRNDDPTLNWFQFSWLMNFDAISAGRARMDRRFALLRHIEALRLYAAEHQGHWPDSLDDIRDLPLPVDPLTGTAFSYRRQNDMAILEALPPPGMPSTETNWIRYELTLRSK